MTLWLRDKVTIWGPLRLESNDVVMEVITYASELEPKVYKNQREMEAGAREFSNRTEVSWDAFIWFVDPDHRNDKSYLDAAKSYFHIHMFATLLLARSELRIDRLLPKSGHDKGDYRVNLANEPLADWEKLVANMSIRTKIAVERFKIHYVERHLIRQET